MFLSTSRPAAVAPPDAPHEALRASTTAVMARRNGMSRDRARPLRGRVSDGRTRPRPQSDEVRPAVVGVLGPLSGAAAGETSIRDPQQRNLPPSALTAPPGPSGVGRDARATACVQSWRPIGGLGGRLKGFAVNPQGRPFFKEFVVRLPRPPAEVNEILRERHGIIGGYDLGRDYPHLADHMLFAVTEVNTRAAIDRLVGALREIAA